MKFDEFKRRRQQLLMQMAPGSAAIIASASELIRNNDAHFRFRQDSHFYYLTGFEEPESIAVIIKAVDESTQFILFCRDSDPAAEQWDGPREGVGGAKSTYQADKAFDIKQFNTQLSQIVSDVEHVYIPFSANSEVMDAVVSCVEKEAGLARSGNMTVLGLTNLDNLLFELRLIKSDTEITLLQKSADIAVEAHKRAMTACQPEMNEYELEAELLYTFKKQGCVAEAYTSIVAAGSNACVLHYIANRDQILDGDLVLIDAGGEYQYYAADITRTFPANGRFTDPQKQVYQAVLDAQLAVIDQIKPGVTYDQLQKTAIDYITQGLIDLGLLSGDKAELIEQKAYQRFYMHNIGHWLGMDVHDHGPDSYRKNGKWRLLEPGMVLTVEPGIYINADCDNVPEIYRGIGIRIEDDILVTESGCDVLTAALPKTIADIEAFMAKSTA